MSTLGLCLQPPAPAVTRSGRATVPHSLGHLSAFFAPLTTSASLSSTSSRPLRPSATATASDSAGSNAVEPCRAYVATGECHFKSECRFSHNFWRRHEILTAHMPMSRPGDRPPHEPVRTCTLIGNSWIAYSEGHKLKVRGPQARDSGGNEAVYLFLFVQQPTILGHMRAHAHIARLLACTPLPPPLSLPCVHGPPSIQFIDGNFAATSEFVLDGNITASLSVGNFLFVAYDATVPGTTAVPVGHIKGFFLGANPFQEFYLQAPGLPFAHTGAITSLDAALGPDEAAVPIIFSGSRDGASPTMKEPGRSAGGTANIRLWVSYLCRQPTPHPDPIPASNCRVRQNVAAQTWRLLGYETAGRPRPRCDQCRMGAEHAAPVHRQRGPLH